MAAFDSGGVSEGLSSCSSALTSAECAMNELKQSSTKLLEKLNDDPSTSDFQEVPVNKPKRGRPPKPKPLVVLVDRQQKVKRPRGRPPKIKTAEELQKTPPKKGKRGRPPKQRPLEESDGGEILPLADGIQTPPDLPKLPKKSISPTVKVVGTNAAVLWDGNVQLTLASASPRKRGRPPKPKATNQSLLTLDSLTQDGDVPPQKKKRGRPPKPKATNQSLLTLDSLTQDGDVPPQKKKRGRPPKPKATNQSLLTLDSLTQNGDVPPQKKKRGRPPKPKATNQSLLTLDSLTQEGDVPPQKKKRGRPPKPKGTNQSLITVGSLSQYSDGLHQKKKRGRPRKSETLTPKAPTINGSGKNPSDGGTTVKRGRGRPRKETKLSTVNEPVVISLVAHIDDQDQEESAGESDEESSDFDAEEGEEEEGSRRKKPRLKKPEPKIYEKESEVHELLKQCGVDDPKKVCHCLKAGIMNGFITLLTPDQDPGNEYGLKQVIAKGECQTCSAKVKATIKQILYQGDVGRDYESGSPEAKIFCPNKCGGIYVGGLCIGDAYTECGKFYNHCVACPRFGTCIYDYRESHCPTCDDHFQCTLGTFSCPQCSSKVDVES